MLVLLDFRLPRDDPRSFLLVHYTMYATIVHHVMATSRYLGGACPQGSQPSMNEITSID